MRKKTIPLMKEWLEKQKEFTKESTRDQFTARKIVLVVVKDLAATASLRYAIFVISYNTIFVSRGV